MVRNIKDCSAMIPSISVGSVTLTELVAPEAMYGKARVFAKAVITPGSSLNYHIHHGESEFYFILKGKAKYSDNGTEIVLGPGDVTATGDGEGHSIENIGDEDLEFIAFIPLK